MNIIKDYNELVFNIYEDMNGYSMDAVFDDEKEIDMDHPAILTNEKIDWEKILDMVKPYIENFCEKNKDELSSLSKIAYGFVDGDLFYIKKEKNKVKSKTKVKNKFTYKDFASFSAEKLGAWVMLYMNDTTKYNLEPPYNFSNITKNELDFWAKNLAKYFDYNKYGKFNQE